MQMQAEQDNCCLEVSEVDAVRKSRMSKTCCGWSLLMLSERTRAGWWYGKMEGEAEYGLYTCSISACVGPKSNDGISDGVIVYSCTVANRIRAATREARTQTKLKHEYKHLCSKAGRAISELSKLFESVWEMTLTTNIWSPTRCVTLLKLVRSEPREEQILIPKRKGTCSTHNAFPVRLL